MKSPLDPRSSDSFINDMDIAPLIVDEHCLEDENTVLSRTAIVEATKVRFGEQEMLIRL